MPTTLNLSSPRVRDHTLPSVPADLRNQPSTAAAVVFDLLKPIGFGFFVGALIFDVVYATNADVIWFKSAA